MPAKKINELTQATTGNDSDLMVIRDVSNAKKITLSTLLTSIKTKLGIGTAANLNTTSKEIVGAINEINTNLDNKGSYYYTDGVNTGTLYANNFYILLGPLTLPPGRYLVMASLQKTFSELQVYDDAIKDFYLHITNANTISYIVENNAEIKIAIRGKATENTTLTKSARYNIFQAVRL